MTTRGLNITTLNDSSIQNNPILIKDSGPLNRTCELSVFLLRTFRKLSNQPEDKKLSDNEIRPLIGCDTKRRLGSGRLGSAWGPIREEESGKS